MDYAFSSPAREFGAEVRTWVTEHLPSDWERRYRPSTPEWVEFQRGWDRQLYAQGWGAVFWPTEYGGTDLDVEQRFMFYKVLAEHNAPEGLGKVAKRLLAPVLIRHGSEEQRSRFLPAILRGDEAWSQGFSEPGAGSDLASLKTRGVVVDGGLVVDGQKVWTSHAMYTDWIFALVRTSTEDRPQRGITFVLIPREHPGVTVRPITQINGRTEFAEVFFDSVLVPSVHVVGEIGAGWNIAKALLEFERGAEIAFGRSAPIRAAVNGVIRDLPDPPDRSPTALARLGRSQASFIGSEVNSLRLLGHQVSGNSPGDLTSVVKLQQTSEWNEAAVEHLKLLGEVSLRARDDHFERYFSSRSATIAAGASEVQRDIIARRVMNLPL